ncbi:MAG: MlaD family protein, partial [Acidobacteriota bacterium]
ILAVGREEGFFRERVAFRTDFPNVDGLAVGSPVRLIGVKVGAVSAITLPVEIGKQEVDVVFVVDRRYRERIRVGTTATLKNLTYLSGEKYVELRPGDPSRPIIPEGGYIESPASEVEQLIAGSKNIATNIEEISNQFRKLLTYLSDGKSLLSRLIQDPDFGRDAFGHAQATLARVDTIVARVEKGEGLVGRLLTDDKYAQSALDRFAMLTERFERMAGRIEKGEGFAGQLLAEDSDLLRAQKDFVEFVAQARTLVQELHPGHGLVGRMLNDEGYAQTIMARVEEMTADLAAILDRIDKGEGTLGRLINEPQLYDQATDVIGGVSDSRFLRWVAHRVRNKQVKQQIRAWAKELASSEKAAVKTGSGGSKP